MAEQTVVVPDIGGSEAAEVVEVLVAPGDTVALEQGLIVLESDKASMEIPSTVAGTVVAVLAAEGAMLNEGAPVAVVATADEDAGEPAAAAESETESASPPPPQAAPPREAAPPRPEPQPRPEPPAERASAARQAAAAPAVPAKPPAPTPSGTAAPPRAGRDSGAYAGPGVRRLAREFGVPLAAVRGRGPRGRILKEDLHAFVQQALDAQQAAPGAGLPSIPDVDFAAFGPVDVVERGKIDKITAANMQRNWLNVPHVTQFDDADITELEAFRKSLRAEAEQRGARLTPLPFLFKACAVALRRHEKFNASLSDGGATLTYKRYVHIGMAVDTPAGLLVPVLRDVDRKPLWTLAEEITDLAARARERKLKPADMQGAGFTISSLGALGGRGFTPIVNAPEVAILGVGRAATQAVWNGAEFEPRLRLPLALSYDHRVVNGGDGGRFLTELCQLLADVRRLLL